MSKKLTRLFCLVTTLKIHTDPQTNSIGGDININTDTLELVNFSLIDTSTYSSKNAGNIDITANSLFLNNNSIIRSLTTNEGDAGNIFLGTPEGRLRPTLILCIKLVHKMHEIGRNRKKTERKKHVFLSLLSHFSIKFNENSFVKTCLDGLLSQRVVSLTNAPKMAQWRRRNGAFMT